MATAFHAQDWNSYRMTHAGPHTVLETPEAEITVVDQALDTLCAAGLLPHKRYDRASVNVIIDPEGLEVSAK